MSRTHVDTISHVIGEDGSLSLKLVSGTVRIVGVDGDEARVRVRMQLHEGQDPREIIEVSHLERELRVHIGDGRSRGLATLFTRFIPDADLEVETPRGAALRLSAVSADLDVRGVEGEQEYGTVSGDLSVQEGSGPVAVQSVSGDVRVQGSRLAVEATSTSGDVEVLADHIEQLRLRSVSGDASVAGALQGGSEHRFESVSGDLRIEPRNGIVFTMSGFSGSAHSELPYREESRGGRRVLVIGDGAAAVTFRSMSGDAEIVAPAGGSGGDDAGRRERHRIDLSARHRARAERDAIHAERDRFRAERDSIREQAHAAREVAREAARAARETVHAAREEAREQARGIRLQTRASRRDRPNRGWGPAAGFGPARGSGPATGFGPASGVATGTPTATTTGIAADQAAPKALTDHAASQQLNVLRALERGEIDVDEAARLLEGAGGA